MAAVHKYYLVFLGNFKGVVVTSAGVVVAGPPKFRFMRGWSIAMVKEYVSDNGGTIEPT